MREPDWEEHFGAVEIAKWLNDRPTHHILALTAAAQARQAERDAEVARLQSALATVESALVTACNMRADVEARTSKAVEVLRQVEFDPGGVCPCCSKFEGHQSSCALHAALAEAGKEVGR